MADLNDGEWVEVRGSGSKPYVIKNVGGVYSCTCPAWRNQSLPIERRTCKHIRALRGDTAEEARLGAALAAPARRPAGAEKEGPPVLLAETWDNSTSLLGWWMSEKLDGVRAYWDGRQFLSRNGTLFLAPEWFLDGLPSTPLDGELWIARKAFNRTSGIVRRMDRPPEWKEIRFVVFDAPAHGGAFEDRLRFLGDLLGRDRPPHLEFLTQEPCRGLDHLQAELRRVEELGGEGLMLRQPGSLYHSGRSSTLLKVKRFHDAEAQVIGHEPGKGRHKGRLGALTVQMPGGAVFSVGTGLTDAERENPPAIGSLITFRYQELSERGVPRFPSYVGIRRDGLMTPAPAAPALMLAPRVSVAVPALPAEVLVRTFDYASGPDVLFWEVTVCGCEVQMRFGPPAAPRSKTERFASEREARSMVEELIAEKLDDGFVERAREIAPPAPPPTPPPSPPTPVAAPGSGAAGRRYFEFVEGRSSKFWEVWVTGCRMTTRYGRIGSEGTMTIKDHADEAQAWRAAEKLIGEKVGKGYVEKTG